MTKFLHFELTEANLNTAKIDNRGNVRKSLLAASDQCRESMFKSIGELNLNLKINSIIVISNQRHHLFKFNFKETA